MEDATNSKVTVGYHDPSGLYPLICHDLASRLPLRHLNWKSPSRPLRLIHLLHLDFVPAPDRLSGAPDASVGPQRQRNDSDSSTGTIWPHGVADSKPQKERRHQIPGLNKTPYLKLYILRCDDKETYKASHRKLLRDWLRDNTHPSQSTNKQDNHDASEWLILHVVIPDTIVAGEPRWTASRKMSDELIERPQSTSRWTSKGSKTVLEKLRADFNHTSSSAPDRIAQIRLRKDVVPPQFLPSVPAPFSYNESQQEQDNAWSDLITKFKTLILMSFDLRVSQYEEDIRERISQRTLPGWNFCTFFILKEGLAKVFESVGLAEDALVIYDELALGLDNLVREEAAADSPASSQHHSEELQHQMHAMRHLLAAAVQNVEENQAAQLRIWTDKPIDSSRKNYREAIVSTNVSTFDFLCYIFAKQLALLLRLGNVDSTQSDNFHAEGGVPNQGDGDLTFLADACKMTLGFATSSTRVLKDELRIGPNHTSSSTSRNAFRFLSMSWPYAVAEQVLRVTSTAALPWIDISPDSRLRSERAQPNGASKLLPNKARLSDLRLAFPKRASSLASNDVLGSPGESKLSETPYSLRLLQAPDATDAYPAGLEEFATYRADLIYVERRALEMLAEMRGWYAGWTAVLRTQRERPNSVSDIAESKQRPNVMLEDSPADVTQETILKLLPLTLADSLTSKEEFRRAYERLSEAAAQHYIVAGQPKSAELMFADLAMSKFQAGDLATAASYFQYIAPSFAEDQWQTVKTEVLYVYARCLKGLHRTDEYMRITLALLRHVAMPLVSDNQCEAGAETAFVDIDGCLKDFIACSEQLPHDFTVPMFHFCSNVTVDQEILHRNQYDGFMLRLSFVYLLEEGLLIDRARLRIVSATGSHDQELWLESECSFRVEKGPTHLILVTNCTTFGAFVVDKVIFEAKKIRLVGDLAQKDESPLALDTTGFGQRVPNIVSKGQRLLVYPPAGALRADVTLSREIHIDKSRSLQISIEAGVCDADRVEVCLRPASAGLRLFVADAIISGGARAAEGTKSGTIELDTIDCGNCCNIAVPYTLDDPLLHVKVRLEVKYRTDRGEFVLQRVTSVSVELPLDVSVHDFFKETALVSKYSIRTITELPLHIQNVVLQGSAAFEVGAQPGVQYPMVCFEKQPASMTYRVARRRHVYDQPLSKRDTELSLIVGYCCLNEVIIETLRSLFVSDLKKSNYAHLERLLMPSLGLMLEGYWNSRDYEKAAVLNAIDIPDFESLGWTETVSALVASERCGVLKWLQEWHKSHAALIIPDHPDRREVQQLMRRVTITVDVPDVDVLHTAQLVFLGIGYKSASNMPVAVVGVPLMAEMRLKFTRQWSTSAVHHVTPSSEPVLKVFKFWVDIHEHPEDWLIGGSTRTMVTAEEDKLCVISLVLIPLRPGYLSTPTIDIRPYDSVKDNARQTDNDKPHSLTCEVDYHNLGQKIQVVSDTHTTSTNVF
ncbi:hypothetical protein LTR66_000675 [Elasticomyces elasticus]|nr:hypothetical protein LTR66_000675 [Elasticomyces elasticus]